MVTVNKVTPEIMEDKYNLKIVSRSKSNFNSYNMYKNHEDQDYLSSGIAYVFFTRPSLHFGSYLPTFTRDVSLYKNVTKENFFNTCPFINDIVNRKSKMYSDVLTSLKGGKGFIYFLTNLAENFETQDVTLETFNANETFSGYKLTLPTSTVESKAGGTFTINYHETRNMEITVFHKIWIDYIEAIRLGHILPAQASIRQFSSQNLLSRGYIDYMNSCYYFLLDADGKTIKYYAKYTGVFPTNVPFNAFNWELGNNSTKNLSITYAYNFKEDMNPEILKEFNYVSGISDEIQLQKIVDDKLRNYSKGQTAEHSWREHVYVGTNDNGKEVHEYLMFE